MSGLVIAAIVLGCIAACLLIGWRLAVAQLPRAWEKARQHWTIPEYIRGSVRGQTLLMLTLWVVVKPARALTASLDEALVAGDPVELAAKVAEKDRYIAQLEREAGIRR